ncbi:pathogenesis-related homeodomain protein isoform X1 [Cryptomeria japonica]|uniref:pathogenesis-related homeodomain protein isoform X1 n=1 Tax=Cryptomeria japonica TaxID=3369 RepID=UPI0025AB8843|nr:pathogenesis-related homeodomain protein isoform X1 [Cryptomeria japonica]XP_057839976.1 pathogenesis-related homeodomain protein isoform X1 [Cryptomeria japonica]
MARAGKSSSGSVKNKQASSNTPSEIRPKSPMQKVDNSGTISGRMRERKPQTHAQTISSVLTKKRIGESSESRNVSITEEQKSLSNSKRMNTNTVAGKLVKRSLQKASKLNFKNESQKRPRKSSALRSFAAGKSERSQQRKTRRSKWKSDSKNTIKEKAEGTCSTEGMKRRQQRRKQKKKAQNVPLDEVLRVNRRIKYLFIKLKLEQTLIDAYSGEGWKGQSREKIRPEKELQRAESQILKCKLGIREAVHQLDLLGSEGRIADAVVDPEGRVFHEHIFCAKCKTQDTFPDNDIILCDGACNRGFHQNCLDPPLATENIPPGDQGWLCKVCECKLEALEAINAHLGTQFTVENSWEEIFAEAAKVANGENMPVGIGEEWPSDDSEDDDYDPEKQENRNETGYEIDTNNSDSSGSSDSSDTSDNVSEASLIDDLHGYISKGKKRCRYTDEENGEDAPIFLDSDVNGGPEFSVSGRRQRKDVDYKKLNDEMFGKDESNKDELSEDEDWGPSRRSRKVKQPDIDAAKDPPPEVKNDTSKGEKIGGVHAAGSMHDKKRIIRLPAKAVEKLREVFSENELPSKSSKENLSQQLGLTFRKVHMWFKNARYMALKNRKEMLTRDKHDETKHSGQRDLGPRKNLWKEKKRESACLLPSIGADIDSRNMKRKRRRKDIKSSLGMPVKTDGKRSMSRLPANAVARFRQVFAENELPSMSSKLALSKQFDIPYRQVHMWFKNARYMALKKKKMKNSKLDAPYIYENSKECILEIDSITQIRKPDDASNPYLIEMEKMGKIEVKLENLRNILEAMCTKEDPHILKDKAQESSANNFNSELVMYVPVAELKEKILQVALVRWSVLIASEKEGCLIQVPYFGTLGMCLHGTPYHQ